MTELHTLQNLVARHIGRPVLMLGDHAADLAARIHQAEPRALKSERGLTSWLRLKARPSSPQAFDDEPLDADPVPQGGYAYSPRWMEREGGPDDDLELGMSLKDGIACLNIDTAITAEGHAFCGAWYHGYDTIAEALQAAFEDPRVKGIFLRFDTPGGVVDAGLDDVTGILQANREKAGGKPVWGYCNLAASAGYWIASSCDRLIAPKTGMVGSMGAIIVHWEQSGWLQRQGIQVTPIQFGARKSAGASYQKLDEEAIIDLQAWVDQAGRDFVQAVTSGRDVLTEEACLATEARLYCACHDDPEHSGLALSLIDDIQREPDAFKALVAHIEQAAPAAASAAPAAQSPEAGKENDMARSNPAAAKRRKAEKALAEATQAKLKAEAALDAAKAPADRRKAEAAYAAALSAKVKAEEDLESAEEDEEETGEGGPAASDDDELNAEEEDDEEGASTEETPPEEDAEEEEDDMKALAIMGLPEARGQEDFARSLISSGFSLKSAKAALRGAKRTNAIRSRTDVPLKGAPRGKSGDKNEQTQAALNSAVEVIKARREARRRPGLR
ncbi:S49 family peptidase [Hyphomonas pacifica]|uniref:Peptidase S49 domain-containing protein n=1 Tax=Hyphomonas pacifica TaxID=1280941 RepID=A0A8B2PMH4_9PROT|nr:S49 family peptidase [Hyphomonas pacifica]RAN30641.1 hypothetical protein HY3_05685 [Hyphomonas pacifica]